MRAFTHSHALCELPGNRAVDSPARARLGLQRWKPTGRAQQPPVFTDRRTRRERHPLLRPLLREQIRCAWTVLSHGRKPITRRHWYISARLRTLIAMRRRANIVWLLLFSILLTPFGTLHAHVATEHQASVLHGGHLHGGHSHELPTDSHAHSGSHAVDVQLVAAGPGSGADRGHIDFRTDWWPPLLVVSLLLPDAPPAGLILRPPTANAPPPSRLDHWKPPLRGPPHSSIA